MVQRELYKVPTWLNVTQDKANMVPPRAQTEANTTTKYTEMVKHEPNMALT